MDDRTDWRTGRSWTDLQNISFHQTSLTAVVVSFLNIGFHPIFVLLVSHSRESDSHLCGSADQQPVSSFNLARNLHTTLTSSRRERCSSIHIHKCFPQKAPSHRLPSYSFFLPPDSSALPTYPQASVGLSDQHLPPDDFEVQAKRYLRYSNPRRHSHHDVRR